MELRDLKVGDYVRTDKGRIAKIKDIYNGIADCDNWLYETYDEYIDFISLDNKGYITKDIIKASDKLIDLVEYMDLLVIENKVKDINNNEVYLFNPVRCDGFTTFENNQHCMIINMGYIIPIENIKIKQILTSETFDQMLYKVRKQNETH